MKLSRFVASTATLALATALHPVPALSTETIVYTYDALGRLVVAQRSGSINNGQVATLCYDPAGNRTRYVSSGAGSPASCTASPSPSPSPSPTPASFSISDAQGTEGSTVVFTVMRSGGTTDSVNYATANGSATSTGDYFAAAGTLTFAAGETSKTITITTRDNAVFESDEVFYINLSGASSGATIADGQGVGTIYDNE